LKEALMERYRPKAESRSPPRADRRYVEVVDPVRAAHEQARLVPEDLSADERVALVCPGTYRLLAAMELLARYDEGRLPRPVMRALETTIPKLRIFQ